MPKNREIFYKSCEFDVLIKMNANLLRSESKTLCIMDALGENTGKRCLRYNRKCYQCILDYLGEERETQW